MRNELTEDNKQLIDHSFFAEWGRERMYSSAMPWWRWDTPIMYALHDINGDGVPELFIGAPYGIAGINGFMNVSKILKGRCL
ncbi:MAG: integrin alpha [Defluviitaleaceae bacterium]|nr:integrin alpha [Defluviitaleaceae bacterium]